MNGPERPIKVLLLEDNPTDVALVTALLEQDALPCDLHRVTTGEDFAAALKEEPFDLIISDYSLPSFNGFAALALRQEVAPDVPFVLFSGSLGEHHAVESLKKGATDYVIKQRPERLGPSVRRAIQEAEDRAERRRIEDRLRKQDELFRRIGENAEDLVAVLDVEGRRVYNSPSYRKLLGDSLLLVGTDSFEEIHPDDRDRIRRLFRETVSTGTGQRTEYRFLLNDGSVRLVESQGSVIRDKEGTVENVVVISRDVTQRKQAEQRLSAHHAMTQVLAESATLTEAAKRILQIACQEFEWDVGEFWTVDTATRRLRCVEIWHPPSTEFNEFVTVSRQTAFAAGEGLPGRVWETGQPAWVGDVAQDTNLPRKALAARLGLRSAIAFPIRLRNETFGVIDFCSAKIRSPDDELLAMFATVGSQIGQFIERKQVDEQFRQSQKMEAFGQLAGGVAHDFNNILAVIMGYTNLLMEGEDLSAELKEQLKQVYSAGERAANLTRQLLTFSRKKEMQVNPLDLNEVIANITKMLGRIIGEDIKLQCNYGSNLPTVQADEGMMEQVLMNLAVNARDAMAKGGQLIVGTDRVTTDAGYVQNNAEARAGDFIRLSVQDTGCGMTPEIMARIFEPFFTTKGVGKGTGLGLATVFGIVKQHQGWIEVESQVGVGTTFKVFLPASAQPDVTLGLAAIQTKVRGGTETILLVEDEMALRGLTKIILQRFGYRVLEAGSGVEALSVWEMHETQIDLLLTDMVMPDGVTGRDLAKRLQAAKPGLKVIYTSGYSLDSEGTTFRARDASTFLQKPYQSQKLAQAVRNSLDS
jgi:two-component system, cell cycle sensor histidine kinase and response regulator CckA